MKSIIDGSTLFANPEFNYSTPEEDIVWRISNPQGDVFCFSFFPLARYDDFRIALKEYVFYELNNPCGNKVATIYSDFNHIIKFLKFVYEQTDTTVLQAISSFHISEYIDTFEDDECLNISIKDILISINKFLIYFQKIIPIYTINETKRLLDMYSSLKSKSIGFHLLPADFFDAFISQAIKDRDDKSLSYEERAYACLLIIQSQVGLRISELMHLEKSAIIGQPSLECGNKFHYLIYKTASKTAEAFTCTSYLNKIALKSWAILYKISKDVYHSESIYLFDIKKEKFKDFQDYLIKFSFKHNKILANLNNSWYNSIMHNKRICDIFKLKEIPEGYSPTDTICYPTSHQFRVFRIHYLLSKGLKINDVARTVGHKDSQTTMSYTRNIEDSYQELRKHKYGFYSKEFLGILTDIAKQKDITIDEYINHSIPNGICHKAECERKKSIVKNFSESE